ncbi:hypothetical protein GQ600_18665 [Phytophthora cactorum]|nr:hypothetical protein GQ600_18665 [Phytophthora cactorum]
MNGIVGVEEGASGLLHLQPVRLMTHPLASDAGIEVDGSSAIDEGTDTVMIFRTCLVAVAASSPGSGSTGFPLLPSGSGSIDFPTSPSDVGSGSVPLATVPSLPASTVVIGIALRLTTAPQAKRQRVVMATTAHRVEDASRCGHERVTAIEQGYGGGVKLPSATTATPSDESVVQSRQQRHSSAERSGSNDLYTGSAVQGSSAIDQGTSTPSPGKTGITSSSSGSNDLTPAALWKDPPGAAEFVWQRVDVRFGSAPSDETLSLAGSSATGSDVAGSSAVETSASGSEPSVDSSASQTTQGSATQNQGSDATTPTSEAGSEATTPTSEAGSEATTPTNEAGSEATTPTSSTGSDSTPTQTEASAATESSARPLSRARARAASFINITPSDSPVQSQSLVPAWTTATPTASNTGSYEGSDSKSNGAFTIPPSSGEFNPKSPPPSTSGSGSLLTGSGLDIGSGSSPNGKGGLPRLSSSGSSPAGSTGLDEGDDYTTSDTGSDVGGSSAIDESSGSTSVDQGEVTFPPTSGSSSEVAGSSSIDESSGSASSGKGDGVPRSGEGSETKGSADLDESSASGSAPCDDTLSLAGSTATDEPNGSQSGSQPSRSTGLDEGSSSSPSDNPAQTSETGSQVEGSSDIEQGSDANSPNQSDGSTANESTAHERSKVAGSSASEPTLPSKNTSCKRRLRQ